MTTWSEFEAAAPDIAESGRRLLYQHGPGLAFLATVRADSGPRLHPICPVVTDGELWAFIIETSPKCADLRRDGRFALHSFPPVEVDDEFLVTGTAVEVDADQSLRRRVIDATSASVGADTEVLFRLDVERVLLATYTHRGQWPPTYRSWRTA